MNFQPVLPSAFSECLEPFFVADFRRNKDDLVFCGVGLRASELSLEGAGLTTTLDKFGMLKLLRPLLLTLFFLC